MLCLCSSLPATSFFHHFFPPLCLLQCTKPCVSLWIHGCSLHFTIPNSSKETDAPETSFLGEQLPACSYECDHCPETTWYWLISQNLTLMFPVWEEGTQSVLVLTDAGGRQIVLSRSLALSVSLCVCMSVCLYLYECQCWCLYICVCSCELSQRSTTEN